MRPILVTVGEVAKGSAKQLGAAGGREKLSNSVCLPLFNLQVLQLKCPLHERAVVVLWWQGKAVKWILNDVAVKRDSIDSC